MGEDKGGGENLNLSPSLSPSHQGREDMGKSWDHERVIEVRTSFDKSGIISVSKFLINYSAKSLGGAQRKNSYALCIFG